MHDSTLRLLTRDEYYSLISSDQSGACAFCNIGEQIVLHETTHWVWIASLSPYFKYHTIFVSKRHITGLGQVSQAEFEGFQAISEYAEAKYAAANLTWGDNTPINMYTYSWRYRGGGLDTTHNVKKSMHLHVHMWPERDGLMTSITDPQAVAWDPAIFTTT